MKRLAIIGVSGLVGQTVLKVLEEDKYFDFWDISLIASERSRGQKIVFCGREYSILELNEQIVKECFDYVLFLTSESISLKWIPKFVRIGAVVIDNSSAYRLDTNVPLIIPEVNIHDLEYGSKIIANPNCSTSQLMLALEPLNKKFGIKRLLVSTYQAVSGAGLAAINELREDTEANLNGEKYENKS